MKIRIPENIKTNIDQIDQVFLEGIIKEEVNSSNSISIEHICSVDFIELHDLFYNNSAQLRYKVLYKEGKTEYFTFASKEDILYRKSIKKETITAPPFKGEEGIFPEQWIWHCEGDYSYSHKAKPIPNNPPEELLYQSPYASFTNTPENRLTVLSTLKEKHTAASKLSDEIPGTKNLIYYSVGGHKSWLELLKLSLLSLIEQGDINYDVLIITTENFKEKIIELNLLDLNIDFLIVPEPISNIELSINKLLIYQYEKITEYAKVLFLDCDIIAIKSFSQLFLKQINHKQLHTHVNRKFIEHQQLGKLPHHFVLPWHGIREINNQELVILKEKREMPFNAGQYLFVPTQQMISHFANVHWFSREWPEKYFFEQALMNYYFCINHMTNIDVLLNVIELHCITDNSTKQINIDSVEGQLIHFMGDSTDAETKIKYIKNYANLSKTQTFISAHTKNGGNVN